MDLYRRLYKKMSTPTRSGGNTLPTSTITYIDAPGQEEARTVMRAELEAIHVSLNTYKGDPWIGIFTYSQTILQAIKNELQRPSHKAYHHNKPIIAEIVTALQYRI